jgi:transposase
MIPGGVRIFVCTEPVDMRRGFDRLAQTARERGDHDPVQGGAVFVFANRCATRLKLLWFERNGACVLYKRLHRARFELPWRPRAPCLCTSTAASSRSSSLEFLEKSRVDQSACAERDHT